MNIDEFIFSKHALEQMDIRGLPLGTIESILKKPETILSEEGKKQNIKN